MDRDAYKQDDNYTNEPTRMADTPMQEGLTKLNSRVEDLGKAIAVAAARLSVISNTHPTAKSNEAAMNPMASGQSGDSPLLDQVNSLCEDLLRQREQLHHILDKLDI